MRRQAQGRGRRGGPQSLRMQPSLEPFWVPTWDRDFKVSGNMKKLCRGWRDDSVVSAPACSFPEEQSSESSIIKSNAYNSKSPFRLPWVRERAHTFKQQQTVEVTLCTVTGLQSQGLSPTLLSSIPGEGQALDREGSGGLHRL